ncbi:MAG: hypothetical protein IPI67_38630 [Myxococcales bacterium]|nr:hypothetical protein [Myxococcales bacterium]
MKGLLKGFLFASWALLVVSACGSDSGGDTTCSCTCTCAGAAPTKLGTVAKAEECKSDCKASCTGEWEAKHDCS